MLKTKVLVTGNGYLCRGICEVLKDKYDITVIDNVFHPDRVSWLVENNIRFFQRDLFDLKDLLADSEALIHTSGMTSVPQSKEASTPEIDAQIMKIGVEGTRYLIENVNQHCKFLFLSSHCVFEGYEAKYNISEEILPRPILAYGRSKEQSETDLIKSGLNYSIARLGSVYGYNPSIRWKIVANLLSKMTAINGKIKVFNSEIYKPSIGINDCCKILKILMEGGGFTKTIYHLVSSNPQIKDIANICKKYKPNLLIENIIDKEIKFGYSLINTRIKFEIKESIDESIGNMIKIWSNKCVN